MNITLSTERKMKRRSKREKKTSLFRAISVETEANKKILADVTRIQLMIRCSPPSSNVLVGTTALGLCMFFFSSSLHRSLYLFFFNVLCTQCLFIFILIWDLCALVSMCVFVLLLSCHTVFVEPCHVFARLEPGKCQQENIYYFTFD